MKSKKLLESFTVYCKQNPEERFWQALRNWAKVGFILMSNNNPEDITSKSLLRDTFYIE